MSFFESKNALAKVSFDGFGGMDKRDPAKGAPKTDELINLRVLEDGSLEKRCGYRPLSLFPDGVRAILTGNFGGEFIGYVLSGYTVYKLDFSTGTHSIVGHIGNDVGRASIFYYFGHFYLCDGEEIYEIGEDFISACRGYAPLLGKDWGSAYPGEIYEPLNILTEKARISYIVSDPPNTFLSTLYEATAVDALYKNGELVDPSEYTLDRARRVISVQGLEAGDRVLAYVSLSNDYDERRRLASNTEVTVFGGINSSRVFMYGGADKNRIFSSGAVSADDLKESERVYGDTGALYFPFGGDFPVGDGKSEVRALSRHYGRLLIFTSEDTWMADSENCAVEEYPTMRINSHGGCKCYGAVAKYGNDPISVSDGRILRWSSRTNTLDDCNAVSISKGIESMLKDSFFDNAVVFEDKKNGEILFSDASASDGIVFVYSGDRDLWYEYSGIQAEGFFDTPDGVGFVSGNVLYCFDKNLDRDLQYDGLESEIEGYFCSDFVDFGLPQRKKRIMEIGAVADIRSGNVSFMIETDGVPCASKSIEGGLNQNVASYSFRINSGRFVRLKLRICIDGTSSARIYRVDLVSKR